MNRLTPSHLAVPFFALALSACSGDDAAEAPPADTWEVSSPAFADGAAIPYKYTCDSRDFPVALESPEVNWEAGPAGTMSYAIVVKHLAIAEGLPPEDPNYFKGFMWAIWDIPASVLKLPANISRAQMPTEIPGAQQWSNRNQFGWFAPCPNADPATVIADPSTRKTDNYGIDVYAIPTATVTLPVRETSHNNYTLTLTKHLDQVNIGKGRLGATSDAISGAAPVPLDPATIVYPAGT